MQFERGARTRQPTGMAGHVSPYVRIPFFHERGPTLGSDKNLQVSWAHRDPHSSLKKGCCRSGMFIPDPRSEFFHPGSRVKRIPDPHQRISVFLTLKTVSKLSDLWSGMLLFIPDPDCPPILDHGSGSLIQGSKITGSGSATLEELELKLSKLTADSDPLE